jgi:hypothetical protein
MSAISIDLEGRQADLTRATADRRRVDEEAKLLANRIALLRQEELKSIKAIQETRKRTEEVVKARLRNSDALRLREEAKSKRDEEERRRSEVLKQQKEMSLYRRALTQENRRRTVEQGAQTVKEAKKQWKESIVAKDHQYRRGSLLTRQRLRADSEGKHLKTKMLQEHKKAQAHNQLAQRIDHETRIREEKERELAEMEQLELQIIQRLQNTVSHSL